ncbi:hypothetical protein RhiirC2_790412, partial [Rhizophagus irregularis]
GRLNQPSRLKRKKLQPLAVGSDGWLAFMKEIYDDHCASMKYEQDRINAGIKWDTTPDQGEYRKGLCDLVTKITDAHHQYELKSLELSTEVIPDVPPASGYLPKKELRSRFSNLDLALIVNYHRDEIGLDFQPCAIMDDRPLKRRANDNGNLDTHYGYHINKKVYILSTSKDLENSSSSRTI